MKTSLAQLPSEVVLRKLNNLLKKDNFLAEENSAACLTTVLLLTALHHLNRHNSLGLLNKNLSAKEIVLLDDLSLFELSSSLYQLTRAFAPKEVIDSMPCPTIEAIKTIKEIISPDYFISLGEDLSSIGFLYQIFGLKSRQNALKATQTANKELSLEQLIAFTKIYTPNWVADFLVANTVLPFIGDQIQPDRFSQWQMDSINRDKLFPEEIKVIDPACGSGQFLLAAFDLFFNIYSNQKISSSEAIKCILQKNLHGADIDIKAIWIASLSLLVKALTYGELLDFRLNNLACSVSSDDLLGSISKRWLAQSEHLLAKSYQVVITNPPYIGRKSLSRELKASLKENYPHSQTDLCTAFLERSLEMLTSAGRLGIITQSSVLTLPSYKNLRQSIQAKYDLTAAINCGTGVFPLIPGEKIDNLLLLAQATALKERKPIQNNLKLEVNKYLELKSNNTKPEELRSLILNSAQPALNHLRDQLVNLILKMPALQSVAEVKQGLATTNNKKFVRYYWDVPAENLGSLWVPYIKGAGSERWYSENNFVVKWGKNGSEIKQAVIEAYPYLHGKSNWVVKNEQFYFKPGLCFSFINKNNLAVRKLPTGAIFDVASSAIFAEKEESFLLAYLNSSLLSTIANTINPTINLQVGDVKRLPLIPFSLLLKKKLANLGESCYEKKEKLSLIQKEILDRNFIDADYLESLFLNFNLKRTKLKDEIQVIEKEIDDLIFSNVIELGYLEPETTKELTYFDEIKQNGSIERKEFAGIVLNNLIGRAVSSNSSDQLVVLPLNDFSQLGLNQEALLWFEKALRTPLNKYFSRAKVFDLGKAIKKPPRYFSLYLPHQNNLLLFSARAWRKHQSILPEVKDLIAQTNKKLANITDWTSKDLNEALI